MVTPAVGDGPNTDTFVEGRTDSQYPVTSDACPTNAEEDTLNAIFNRRSQDGFREALRGTHPGIVARLEQPFGKDNLRQAFSSEASLRHVLLPLWKSGFLVGQDDVWEKLCDGYLPARMLMALLRDYGDTKFHGIRGYNPDWASETSVNQDRVAMATAALLHFDGNVADLVRWIGGPHVAAHLDHASIIDRLKSAKVDPDVVSHLSRIFFDGIPAQCNVSSTEENFLAYYHYGNHSTVDDEPEKTYKAMVKDNRKGFTLLFDQRVTSLVLHCHLTPQGIVDLLSLFKNPRPIFDSSFRPHPWCHAINDWTTKETEPPLTFAGAEMGFMVWLYNLRITYPDKEIYIADDDISGAFRLCKYHPNLMSMHSSRYDNTVNCVVGCCNPQEGECDGSEGNEVFVVYDRFIDDEVYVIRTQSLVFGSGTYFDEQGDYYRRIDSH